MRATFIRTLLFVAGLLLAMEAVHLVLMAGLHHKRTGDYGVWNRVAQGRINADVLVSGSSRALVDFDSARIATGTGLSCFNIGIDGARLDAQTALLKMYLRHNRAPRVVLQVLDAFSLEALGHVYQPSLYAPYLGEPDILRYVTGVDPSFWAHRIIPLYSFALDKDLMYGALNVFLGREKEDLDPRRTGYWGRDLAWDGSFDRFKQEHPGGIAFGLDPAVAQGLGDLIASAQQSGAKVILVYPPELAENFDLTTNRAEIFRTFHDIAARYGVPLWDYSDDPLCRDRSAFYNSQHLNRDHAEIFSAQLAERLKNHLASP